MFARTCCSARFLIATLAIVSLVLGASQPAVGFPPWFPLDIPTSSKVHSVLNQADDGPKSYVIPYWHFLIVKGTPTDHANFRKLMKAVHSANGTVRRSDDSTAVDEDPFSDGDDEENPFGRADDDPFGR